MAGYEEALDELRKLDVGVVALSVDDREEASDTVEELSLSYPVLWGLDPNGIGARYGAYVHEEGYLQPVNFLVRDGVIQQTTYSSGPLGRLTAEEVVSWVEGQ